MDTHDCPREGCDAGPWHSLLARDLHLVTEHDIGPRAPGWVAADE